MLLLEKVGHELSVKSSYRWGLVFVGRYGQIVECLSVSAGVNLEFDLGKGEQENRALFT